MRKTTKFFLLNLVISIAGLASPELMRGQFLGYVSPQTVVQTLTNTVSCTGSAQNFVTANLGQTQHNATISGNNARQLQMEIQGVDGSGNATRISDVLDNAQLTPTPTTITGNGYFPIVRVKVTCSGAGSNFTVTYTGTSSTNPQPVGGYQVSQIDKAMFLGQPANATQSDNFQTPFGNSAGFLQFQYNTAGVAGSVINVTCAGNLLTTYSTTLALPNVLTLQTFQVAASPCTAITVQYVSGGATAGTITAEYIFYVPGTQTTLTTPNTGTSAATPIATVSDGSSQAFFYSSSIANPTTAIESFINANSGSRTLYFDRMIIACTASCSPAINLIVNLGNGCITGTRFPINQKAGSAVTSTAAVFDSAFSGVCSVSAPGISGTMFSFIPIAANTPLTIDLRGIVAPAGTTTGIDINLPTIVGTFEVTYFWYEK